MRVDGSRRPTSAFICGLCDGSSSSSGTAPSAPESRTLTRPSTSTPARTAPTAWPRTHTATCSAIPTRRRTMTTSAKAVATRCHASTCISPLHSCCPFPSAGMPDKRCGPCFRVGTAARATTARWPRTRRPSRTRATTARPARCGETRPTASATPTPASGKPTGGHPEVGASTRLTPSDSRPQRVVMTSPDD